MTELAAAMCDCEVTRLVVDAHGAPLDLGRAQRLFTGPQRRAVIARDRECAWPDCHAHARYCQIHHIRWWERDAGPTSVANGVLLCSYHHHEVHRRDLTITRLAAGTAAGRSAEGPSSRSGALGSLAAVRYEFRDPGGVRVGESPPSEWGRSGPRGSSSPDPPRGGPTESPSAGEGPTAAPATSRGTGAAARPPGEPGDEVRSKVGPESAATGVDELDLGWTTDPFTGGRMPAFMLGV